MGSERANPPIRLNKFISQSGITSRRKADELILSGQVKVNGKTIRELGIQVDAKKDNVVVSGKPVKFKPANSLCFMFYKPKNVLTTLDDPKGRESVADYIAGLRLNERLFPVGRLDWQSEGMLMITNDGDLAHRILHPQQEIPKTYLVKLSGQPTEAQLNRLRRGTSIVGGRVRASSLIPLRKKGDRKGKGQHPWFKIIIKEGKNRQIRQMFSKIGYDVLKLQRVGIGRLRIGSLQPGEFRRLSPIDIGKLFESKPEELHTQRINKQKSKPSAGSRAIELDSL